MGRTLDRTAPTAAPVTDDGALLGAVRGALAAHGIAGEVTIAVTASESDPTVIASVAGERFVVKLGDADAAGVVRQAALLDHVAHAAPRLPLPRVMPESRTGALASMTPLGIAVVTTFCPGASLEGAGLDRQLIVRLADAQVSLVRALADAPAVIGVPERNEWSIESFPLHVDAHLDVAPPALQPVIEQLRHAFDAARPRLRSYARQVIHADFNLSNILVEDGKVAGILDFGDAITAPVVLDVAVAACYLGLALGALDHPLVETYTDAACTGLGLDPDARAIVPLLAACRAAMVVLLGRATATSSAHPDYALRYDALAVTALDGLRDTAALDLIRPRKDLS